MGRVDENVSTDEITITNLSSIAEEVSVTMV